MPYQDSPDVAVVLFKYFPHGGAQRDAVRLARELSSRGVRVQVFAHQIEGCAPEDIDLVTLPASGLQNYTKHQSFARQLAERLTPETYIVSFVRLAQAHHYMAVDPCFKNRVRGRRPLWVAGLNPRDRYYLDAERRVLTDGRKRYCFLADSHLDDYRSAYPLNVSRCEILPPEVRDDCRWRSASAAVRADTRQQLGFTEEDIVLLAVGSGFRTKGLDRTIDCTARLRAEGHRVTLLVIGDDDESAYRRQAARASLTDQVRFLGGRDDLPALYFAGDVLLHPARFEAAGKALVEALAAGVPVLTTDVCGYASLVTESGGGIVLPAPFDQQSLEAAAIKLMESDRRARLSAAARSFGGSLSENAMISAMADSVERGLAEHAKRDG